MAIQTQLSKSSRILALAGSIAAVMALASYLALQKSSDAPASDASLADGPNSQSALVARSRAAAGSTLRSAQEGPSTQPTEALGASAAVKAATPKAAAGEALSKECQALRTTLVSANLNGGWRPDGQALRALGPATACTSSDPKLTALQSSYEKACAAVIEGRFLDDSKPDDRKALATCAQAATAMRAYLGYLSAAGKPVAEITDPSVLVDKLLVATGIYDGSALQRGPLQLNPSSYSEVASASLRLMQIAEGQQQENMAARFYVAAEAESAGLTPREVFRGTVNAPSSEGGTPQAAQSGASQASTSTGPEPASSSPSTVSPSAPTTASTTLGTSTGVASTAGVATTTAPSTDSTSAATTTTANTAAQEQQIADIRGQVEAYNPGFFNHPAHGGGHGPASTTPTTTTPTASTPTSAPTSSTTPAPSS